MRATHVCWSEEVCFESGPARSTPCLGRAWAESPLPPTSSGGPPNMSLCMPWRHCLVRDMDNSISTHWRRWDASHDTWAAMAGSIKNWALGKSLIPKYKETKFYVCNKEHETIQLATTITTNRWVQLSTCKWRFESPELHQSSKHSKGG